MSKSDQCKILVCVQACSKLAGIFVELEHLECSFVVLFIECSKMAGLCFFYSLSPSKEISVMSRWVSLG